MDILSIIIAIFCGFGCHRIAQNNGRNTTLAFVMGILFGLISVVVYLLLGKSTSSSSGDAV